MPSYFMKIPVTIEAMLFDGSEVDCADVYQWVESNTQGSFDINDPSGEVPASGVSIDAATGFMVIATLEGVMQVKKGDWVIRGVKGEFYPCKPDIFEKTYEPTEVFEAGGHTYENLADAMRVRAGQEPLNPPIDTRSTND